MKTYISSILSDEQVERLIFLGRVMADAQWEIGRMTVNILGAIDRHNEIHKNPESHIGYMDVYKYVSDITGKRDRSIRRYVAVCQFYSPQTVDEFDVLPFEYFAEAMAYPSRWRQMLETAVRAMDDKGGRLPGVTWMSNVFQAENHDDRVSELANLPIEIEQDSRAYETVAEKLETKLDETKDYLTYSVSEGSFLLNSIYRVVGLMRENIAKLPVTSERKVKILTVVESLMKSLEEVKKELAGEVDMRQESV